MKKAIALALATLLLFSPLARGRQVSKGDFIRDINIRFLKGDYAGVIKNAEADLSRYRLTRNEKKEILHLTGLSHVKTGAFDKAREVFYDILTIKGSKFREEAYVGIGDSYFSEKRFDEAIKTYEDVLNIYPRGTRLSSVYYNLALSYKVKKDFGRANYYFEKIKGKYNTSFESDKVAYLPTGERTDYYIIQLGAFRSLRNAKKLMRRLTRKKYDSYVLKAKRDGEVLYKVRGGKFSNKQYAMKLLRKLRKDRFQAKIIVE